MRALRKSVAACSAASLVLQERRAARSSPRKGPGSPASAGELQSGWNGRGSETGEGKETTVTSHAPASRRTLWRKVRLA